EPRLDHGHVLERHVTMAQPAGGVIHGFLITHASPPPARRHNRRLPTAQDALADEADEHEDERGRLRECHDAAGQDIRGAGIPQRFESAAETAEADTGTARDETRRLQSATEEEHESQVAGRGVELERMTRRGPERGEDDAPGKRGRTPVAAARQETPDPADP